MWMQVKSCSVQFVILWLFSKQELSLVGGELQQLKKGLYMVVIYVPVFSSFWGSQQNMKMREKSGMIKLGE